MSQWLYNALAEGGLPVICVETRHMRAVLKAQINKTDRNDARGMAQMMRVGLYRPVHVKTLRSQKLRMLLTHRKLLQSKAIAVDNDLRGTLRNFGLKVGMVGTAKFEARIKELVENLPDLAVLVEPLLIVRRKSANLHCRSGVSREYRLNGGTGSFGLIGAITAACVGYAVKYWNDIQLEKRKAEIKLLSDQIQYLYGPLYALCSANEAAWETFRSKCRPRGAFFSEENPPTSEELAEWRQWTTEVFMPLNRKIVEIILKNTHLIDGNGFPEPFSAIISHVKPYEIVVAKWEKGDFSEYTAYSDYPDEINNYVKKSFSSLKSRQVRLLARYRV